MSDLPNIPEFKDLGDVQKWLQDRFAGAYAADLLDRDLEIRKAVNEKHAPVLIPQVTIDAAHAQKNLAAATVGAVWTAISWQNTANTTSASYQTAVDYIGRGVLTKCAIAEITAGANNNRSFSVKITIDGNVVYEGAPALTRESAIRVVVGNIVEVSASLAGITDDCPGLPFNASCKIEYASDGTRTLHVGWKIAKKL